MAIALRTGSAVAWASGSTIVSASMTVTAGNIIICGAAFDPDARTATFSKSAGTGAVGSFTTRTKLTNGVHGLTVGYCSVTTSGTVTITATANSTPTSGTLVIEVYSGASGIKGGTGGTGSTGTDLTRSITTSYANSWVVMVGSCIATTTTPSTGTGCTVERSIACNITGTANDVTLAIGSNEAALSVQTFASHMVKANNVAYCADILELVQQWTVSASGGSGGSQADKVNTNLKSVSVTESVAVTGKTASAIKAATVTEQATVTGLVAGLSKALTVTESGGAAASVSANKKALSVSEGAAVSAKVMTNTKARSVTESGSATAKVMTNKKTSTVSEGAIAVVRITANKMSVTAIMGASAIAVAYNAPPAEPRVIQGLRLGVY